MRINLLNCYVLYTFIIELDTYLLELDISCIKYFIK